MNSSGDMTMCVVPVAIGALQLQHDIAGAIALPVPASFWR